MSQYSMEWGGERSPDVPVRLLPPSKVKPAAPGRDFYPVDLTRRLRTMPDSGALWLVKDRANMVDEGSATAHFTLIPPMAHGRHQSRRQVVFGQLVVNDAARREHVELVALKPGDPGLVAREFDAMNAVNGLALAGKTFTPLGFYRAPGQQNVSLVTRYEHPVKTLDLLLWNPDRRPTRREVCAALSHAALATADLHNAGVASGDNQPKNIGADTEGPRYVDLEGAADFRNRNGGVDSSHVRKLVAGDLRDFLLYLDGDYTDLVGTNFAEPYCDIVQASDSQVPPAARLTPAEVMDIARQPQVQVSRFGA